MKRLGGLLVVLMMFGQPAFGSPQGIDARALMSAWKAADINKDGVVDGRDWVGLKASHKSFILLSAMQVILVRTWDRDGTDATMGDFNSATKRLRPLTNQAVAKFDAFYKVSSNRKVPYETVRERVFAEMEITE